MHRSIPIDHKTIHSPHKGRKTPMHNPMAPERRTRKRHPLRPTTPPNHPQHRPHEIPRIGDERARSADLRHGRRDEIALHELDLDAVGLQLRPQRRRPLLQERFAAGVGGQQRRGQHAAEGTHRQHQPASPLHHSRRDELRDAQRADAVDGDDVPHLALGRLREGNRDVMALPDVVDQHRHVQALHQRPQPGVVVVVVGGEVHGEEPGLHRGAGIFGLDLLGEGLQFRVRAGDEEEVEAFLRELDGEFLADAVRGAGDDRPASFGAELAKL